MRYFIKFGLISFFLIGIVSCHKALPVPEPQPQYDPRNISRTDSTQSAGPWVAIGPDGTVYVAWMDGSRTGYEPFKIYFRYKTPGGNWSDIEILSDSLHNAWGPHIAADPSGNVHLVWRATTIGHNDFKIYYRMRYPSGEWSETRVLSGDEQADQPRIAVDSLGTVHVIWNERSIKYREKPPDGEWSAVESWICEATNPSIVADSRGGVHIVGEVSGGEIKYIYRSPSGEWSQPVNVSNTRYRSLFPDITIAPDGKIWVFWTEVDHAGGGMSTPYYSIWDGEKWTPPDTVPFHGEVCNNNILFSHETPVYVFTDCSWGGDVKAYELTGGRWEEFATMGTDSGASLATDATVDGVGRIHVVWGEWEHMPTGKWEIYYEVILP